jgi:hypothetical protein
MTRRPNARPSRRTVSWDTFQGLNPPAAVHANVAKFIFDGAYTREMLPETRAFLARNGIGSVTRWEPAR